MNTTSDENAHIRISHSDLAELNLGQKVEVAVGQRLNRIKVLSTSMQKTKLAYINNPTAQMLLLPAKLLLDYKVIKNPPRIKLGPVVGVLTTANRNSKSGLPIGKETYYLGELVSYARRKGVFVYLFYSTGVNWHSQTIKGYTLDFNKESAHKWVSGEYPFPDIVYNRIRSRNVENSRTMVELLDRFQHLGINLFNTRFLDKWDVYNALMSSPRLRHFLPPTVFFSRVELFKFLQQYPEVFLKPRNSSIGKGIVKIKRTSGCYMLALAKSAKPSWHYYDSYEELYQALLAIMDDSSRYLVQMGIELAKIQNKVFDLRTQVQKNGRGEWTLTGTAVREAAPDRFVTHIPNGGSARKYDEVIEKTFGSSVTTKRSLDKQLHLIAREAPIILDDLPGWSLAVLSIDIGIDRYGKIWIIEINSKPSSFDEPDIRRAYLRYFTDYCKYITFKNID
ncbi:MAG TPA: hypothetical protein DER33_01205 [Syntrophomonas sp.]|jgi:hypothetical protein|nr:hypothetical protein [Syntrophomonas sp.]HCF70206.1 hypothetical protein [Syntrophomonas sp.]